MEREKLYEELGKYKEGSKVFLEWDRGNGPLERVVYFNGFDKKGPLLSFDGGAILDFEKIGGYQSIISIRDTKS